MEIERVLDIFVHVSDRWIRWIKELRQTSALKSVTLAKLHIDTQSMIHIDTHSY